MFLTEPPLGKMAFMRPSVRSRPAPPEKKKGFRNGKPFLISFLPTTRTCSSAQESLFLGLLSVFPDEVFDGFQIEVL
jgi:hypothetical protein